MAAITLLEAAKQARDNNEYLKAGVIEQFASNSPVLDVLPFEEVAGGTVEFQVEKKLPTPEYRAINAGFNDSYGEVEDRIEKVVIAGGEVKIDTAIIKLKGANVVNTQTTMFLKALQAQFHNNFFNGDSTIDPRQFSGLRARAFGTQLLAAGNTSGGDPLSLSALDEAISKVRPLSPIAQVRIYSNMKMRLRYAAAIRNQAIAGYVVQDKNEFGQPSMSYGGIPWMPIEEDATGVQILPFLEAQTGGGTPASTSIYIVAFGENDVSGIQTGGIDVRDLGEMQTETKRLIRFDWLANFATYNPRSFVRLSGIRDAAIVA